MAQLSMLATQICAIDAHQVLRCWGDNTRGQLGIGFGGELGVDGSVNVSSPTIVDEGQTFRRVSAGINTTCAIRTDGALFCWGENQNGLLLDGTVADRALPTRVGSDSDWEEVSVSWATICGIRDHGKLFCWRDAAGPEVAISGGPAVRQISMHYYGAIALDDLGQVYLANLDLGNSISFQYAYELSKASHVAMQVFGALSITEEGLIARLTAGPDGGVVETTTGADRFRAISGSYDVVAVDTDGRIHFQPLPPTGPTTPLSMPTLDSLGNGFVDVRQAVTHRVCGLRENGSVWCFDTNGTSEVGPAVEVLAADEP